MVEIRKIITTREVVLSELGVAAPRPVVRAIGMAVIRNPMGADEEGTHERLRAHLRELVDPEPERYIDTAIPQPLQIAHVIFYVTCSPTPGLAGSPPLDASRS